MAPVDTYGLKFCVIEVSGELSITSGGAELVLPDDDDDPAAFGLEELDEHAATPAARNPAAATAMNRLWFGNLLFILCLSSRVLEG
jgi:hypothetical protein